MKLLLLTVSALFLAACGAESPPSPPDPALRGVSLDGELRIGVRGVS